MKKIDTRLPPLTILAPCSHLHDHVPMVTFKNAHWQRCDGWLLSPELVLKIDQQKNHRPPQKITGIPRVNGDGNWNHEKNWHEKQKKMFHCPGYTFPLSCSMFNAYVPMVSFKQFALTGTCNGNSWLLNPEMVLKIDHQKNWLSITKKITTSQ